MAKKLKPLNPFILSSQIPDDCFCDRIDESQKLVRQLVNGNNVLLISPRRLGKSGLIHHVFNMADINKHYYTFFIDIYETSTLEEFTQLLGQEVMRKLSSRSFSLMKRFLASLSSIKGTFALDPTTGMPTFSVGIADIKYPESTLDEILTCLDNADKPCIVAIDEFQKIADYQQNNVEAVLRTRIQQLRNTYFVFSGSERAVLAQMFGSASRPFYQSTSTISLGPIDRQVYADFSKQLFTRYGKSVDVEAVYDLYDLVQGYTFYLQRAMNESFSLLPVGEICTSHFIFDRIDEILTANRDTYQSLLSSLTPNQRALLSAVAREGVAMNITSNDFSTKYGLGPVSSIQTAARTLLKRQLITRDTDKKYYLDDKFLELWLARPFGITPKVRLQQNRAYEV